VAAVSGKRSSRRENGATAKARNHPPSPRAEVTGALPPGPGTRPRRATGRRFSTACARRPPSAARACDLTSHVVHAQPGIAPPPDGESSGESSGGSSGGSSGESSGESSGPLRPGTPPAGPRGRGPGARLGGRKVPHCKLPVRAPHRPGSVLGPPGRGGCALWVLRGPPPRSARPGRRPKPHAALLRRVAPPAPSPVQPPQSPFQLTQADSPRQSHPGRHAIPVGRSAHTGFPRSARLSPEHPVP
jgi:hypothetical protein